MSDRLNLYHTITSPSPAGEALPSLPPPRSFPHLPQGPSWGYQTTPALPLVTNPTIPKGTGKPWGHPIVHILGLSPHIQQTWEHLSPLGAWHGSSPSLLSLPWHGALPWAQRHPMLSHGMRLPHSSPLTCLPASAGSSLEGGPGEPLQRH